ncbi:rRNA adenine N-6-methyltransferase family protein [Mesorhizobium sp.]|uniref:class I SAM-dependent methyltransferase n=1 Tax=Mesorhizobium sp. TaxID=1871066 RepID=UPI0025C105AD|nr:rRNA adenine N-6-methyltransferase family protein [Mesorhizobium sp.]
MFLRAWISDPLRVAAVSPSSSALADLITSEITSASSPVIELGPGTGVFTRALLKRGVPEDRLVLVESDPDFSRLLVGRFPSAQVLSIDAARFGRAGIAGLASAGAAISGLPLLSMPPKKVMAILEGTFDRLRPHGALYQFTYGLRCPIARPVLDRLGLKAVRIGGTVANLPPASVYRITRRPRRARRDINANRCIGRPGAVVDSVNK